MSIKPETALHRLRILYRDAHHCEPPTDRHAIDWAAKPELWAEHQIRFRGWSWHATEATVREARKLYNRITVAAVREAGKLYNRITVAGLPLQQEAQP